jgi:hypothetical protein
MLVNEMVVLTHGSHGWQYWQTKVLVISAWRDTTNNLCAILN